MRYAFSVIEPPSGFDGGGGMGVGIMWGVHFPRLTWEKGLGELSEFSSTETNSVILRCKVVQCVASFVYVGGEVCLCV